MSATSTQPTVTRRDAADGGARREVVRYDRGSLTPMEVTDEGFLRVEGFIARPGIYEYRTHDGQVIRELIEPAELHNADSLATLALKPVTNDHPDEDVTPENSAKLAVGAVDPMVDVMQVGGFVRIRFCVNNRDAIEAINAGKRELSPGYRCEIDPTPGTHPDYGRYDARQLRRRYNHAAIVDAARGGREIRLRADGAAQIADPLLPPAREAPVDPTLIALLTLLGVTRFDDVKSATADGLRLLQKSRKDAEEAVAAAETAAAQEETAEGEKLKAAGVSSIDELVKQRNEAQAKIDELVKQVEAYKAKEETVAADHAKAADKKDRATLDSLCEKLRVTKKDDATSTADYSRYVVTEAGIKLATDAPIETVRGVVVGLAAQHRVAEGGGRADAADDADPYEAVRVKRDGAAADPMKGKGTGGQPERTDAAPTTGSTFLDNIAKRFPHGTAAQGGAGAGR